MPAADEKPGFARPKRWKRPALFALALGLACPTKAYADDPSAEAGKDASPAGNGPEEVRVRGSNAGAFTNRIEEGRTTRTTTDAASLLEAQPGLHVRRLGADDGFATLQVRGTSSNQLMVYLAGIPLSSGPDPTVDLSTIPLWPGSTMRVHRTFAPATLGRGSLGGTLSIDPPAAYGRRRAEVFGSVGSFGSARARTCLVTGVEAVRTQTTVCLSMSRSSGEFEYLDPLASSGGAPVFAERKNAGHAELSFLGQRAVAFSIGPFRGQVRITSLLQSRKQDLPGTVRAPTPALSVRAGRGALGTDVLLDAGPGVVLLRGWGKRETSALTNEIGEAQRSLGPTRTDDAVITVGATAGWFGLLGRRTRFSAVLDGSGERYAPSSWEGASTPDAARRWSLGTGADLEQPLGPLKLTLAGRIDQWIDRSEETSVYDVLPTAHAGAEVRAGKFSFAAHGGAVARPPSFLERYGNRGAFLGDPKLAPERAFAVDMGGHAELGRGARRLEGDVVLFGTFARDLITFVPEGAYGRARASNIGRARILGIEASLFAKYEILESRVSYTWMDARNLSDCDSSATGECSAPPLPGRPESDLAWDLAYVVGPFRARYGIDFVSGIRADRTGALPVPERLLQSVGLRYSFPKRIGLELTFDIKNIGDLRYASFRGLTGPVLAPIGDAFDFPLPGRSFLLTLRYTHDLER
ncbi:MAG: TonB-dependent receptor [Polyangiaceae bacterium]